MNTIPAAVNDLVDDLKEDYINNHLITGFSNCILFEKFRNFRWPLWLDNISDYKSRDYKSNPNPLLLNSSFREWQSFTNFISTGEVTVDRAGMISGPGCSSWSLEFWISRNGRIHRPQEMPESIKGTRNIKTGELSFLWNMDGITFSERIAGSKSSVNEVMVSLEINAKVSCPDSSLFAVVRPYNNNSIGGVNSISIDDETRIVSINGQNLLGFETSPGSVITGSGIKGDIDQAVLYNDKEKTVECSLGMATSAMVYSLKPGKNLFNFRMALESDSMLPAVQLNYGNLFREFALFTEMRLAEGIRVDLTDREFTSAFMQSKLSILNINYSYISGDDAESYLRLYYCIYALCRSGAFDTAESFMKYKIEKYNYNRKLPEFVDIIKGSFLIKTVYEIFIHKRETAFLQIYYMEMKVIADYIYKFSVEIHSISQLQNNTKINSFAKHESISDMLYIYSALSNISYLARCIGIFGDESKFKNESIRLQALIANSLNRDKIEMSASSDISYGLLSLPENVLSSYKNDEYRVLLDGIISSFSYPLIHSPHGIDMLSSVIILNQLITSGNPDFNNLYRSLLEYTDDFFVLPEFIDPTVKRGSWGDGNSKKVNAALFTLMRNRLFIDSHDRLELFPVPENLWFQNGAKIRVENAPSRYGNISFTFDVIDQEARLTLGGTPKYLPPDIMINLPIDTSIIMGDDFILKKKYGNSYLINGWPASIRFSLSSYQDSSIKEE